MKTNTFIIQLATSIVMLCFVCNIAVIDYACAEESARPKELKETRVSESAYSALQLIARQNNAEHIVSIKNDLNKIPLYTINKNVPNAPTVRIASYFVNSRFDAPGPSIINAEDNKIREILQDKTKIKTPPENSDKDLLSLTSGGDNKVDGNKGETAGDRARQIIDDLKKQADKLKEIQRIADAFGRRWYDINNDGKLDDQDIARMKKFFEDAGEYMPYLSPETFRTIDINGDGRIDDEDFRAWDEAMREEEKPAVERFADELIKELLDINKDGRIDESDGVDPDMYRYHGNFDFIFISHAPGGRSGINNIYPDDETKRLLKYVWFKLVQNNNGTWDIGERFQVNKTGEGRWGIEIVISNGDWMLVMTNPEPPGVDTGSIRTLTRAYDGLEEARKRAEAAFALKEAKKRGWAKNIAFIGEEKAGKERDVKKEKEARSITVVKQSRSDKKPEPTPEQVYKNSKDSTGGKALNKAPAAKPIAGKKGDAGISVRESGLKTGQEARAAEVVPESDEAVKARWHNDKESFIETFNRVSAEEPGAVYSSGNAVILLTSSARGIDNKDSGADDEGGPGKGN